MGDNYQLAIVGSGSGGCGVTRLAARNDFRAALIERDRIGGAYFHGGCYAVGTLQSSRVPQFMQHGSNCSAYLECWKCPNWRAPNGFGAGNAAAISGRFQRELTMNNRSLQQANPTDPGETRGHPNVLPMDATLEIGGEKFSVERGLFDMLPNHRNNPRE
jgi:choline dehydrogenase-like flavoprotein